MQACFFGIEENEKNEENDESLEEQLDAEASAISRILDKEEINLTLSGPYDDRSAIVTIQPGAGGTDSQDWAEMLFRMYCKWAETSDRTVQVMDQSYGDEAPAHRHTLGPCVGESQGKLSATKAGQRPSKCYRGHLDQRRIAPGGKCHGYALPNGS